MPYCYCGSSWFNPKNTRFVFPHNSSSVPGNTDEKDEYRNGIYSETSTQHISHMKIKAYGENFRPFHMKSFQSGHSDSRLCFGSGGNWRSRSIIRKIKLRFQTALGTIRTSGPFKVTAWKFGFHDVWSEAWNPEEMTSGKDAFPNRRSLSNAQLGQSRKDQKRRQTPVPHNQMFAICTNTCQRKCEASVAKQREYKMITKQQANTKTDVFWFKPNRVNTKINLGLRTSKSTRWLGKCDE